VELHLAGVQDPQTLERTVSELVGKGVQALIVSLMGCFSPKHH